MDLMGTASMLLALAVEVDDLDLHQSQTYYGLEPGLGRRPFERIAQGGDEL